MLYFENFKKLFSIKNVFVEKKVMVIRKFWAKKIVGEKESLIKKIRLEKNLGVKKISEKILPKKNFS